MFPTFDVAEIAEEAAERAGIEFRSGYGLRSARRSLELLNIEWANRGLNLWTLETTFLPLQKSVSEYFLPEDTIDLIEHELHYRDQSDKPVDFPLARASVSVYEAIPRKLAEGRPSLIHIRRKIQPSFVLYLVPDREAYYSLRYVYLRRMKGLGQGGVAEPEVPFRFIPALTAGLAYYLALKNTDPAAQQRVPMLKTFYEEQFTLASDEDRDRAPVRFVPWGYPL